MLAKLRTKRQEPVRHICDINHGSESHLTRLPPNARTLARLKRHLQKVLLVSAHHPFTKLYLRSKAAIAFEKSRHGVSKNWWIIHPCSNFRFAWDVAMFFTYLYMFVTIPHMLSFYRLSKQGMHAINPPLSVLTPGYAICLMDIGFNFITGFISTDGHEIFLNLFLIVKNYVTKFFIVDLLSSVPCIWFYRDDLQRLDPETRCYFVFLELFPLLKFFRLVTLRLYIKEIVVAYGASRVYEHGIWICCLTVLIFHWAACLTYAFPYFYAYFAKTPLDQAVGYVFSSKLYEQPNWLIYLTSLHMGGGNLCSYSHIEFKFTDLPDKVTRCILLLFGMAFFLYVIVTILQLVNSAAEPELKYQSIINGVKDYVNNKKLPKKMKERLLDFYEHRFQGNLFKEKAIKSTLSKHLKHEISQHNSRILLESTPLFNGIPRSLINNIIGVLRQVIYLKDDVVYKHGDDGKCMFFVIAGELAVISYSGREIFHVNDGHYFGEVALLQHEHKRINSVIALEVCEVLLFDRRDFNRLVSTDSEFYARLELLATKRISEIKRVDEEEDDD